LSTSVRKGIPTGRANRNGPRACPPLRGGRASRAVGRQTTSPNCAGPSRRFRCSARAAVIYRQARRAVPALRARIPHAVRGRPVCLPGLQCECMVQRLRSLRLAITYARKLAPAGRSPAARFCGGQCPPHPHVSHGRWGRVRRRGAGLRRGRQAPAARTTCYARLTRRRNTRAPRAGTSCIALSHRCTDVPYPTAPPGAEAARPHTFAAIARDVQ
jgi:hypothetical protein